MKKTTSLLTTLLFVAFFYFAVSTFVDEECIKNEKTKNNKKKNLLEDKFLERLNSSVSFQRYIFPKSFATYAKANLQRQKPKCLTHDKQQDRDHNDYIQQEQQKDARVRLALHQRQLERGGGSRTSNHTSSSKGYYNIVILTVLVFMIMLCVGLKYCIGTSQGRSFPPVTAERKEQVIKDMSEEVKRSVLEYIFKKQLKEMDDDENIDFTTDPDGTESIKQKKVRDEDVKESLHSMDSIEDNKKEVFKNENSEISVDTISTRSSTIAENKDKDDICSICLDSFGTDGKVEESEVLSAPNCSHRFHKECIMEWFLSQSSNLTCPDCRSQMFTLDELRNAATAMKRKDDRGPFLKKLNFFRK